jgi:hypothetical protein
MLKRGIKFTNIRQPMLKLKAHSGFHDLFLKYICMILYNAYCNMSVEGIEWCVSSQK